MSKRISLTFNKKPTVNYNKKELRISKFACSLKKSQKNLSEIFLVIFLILKL